MHQSEAPSLPGLQLPLTHIRSQESKHWLLYDGQTSESRSRTKRKRQIPATRPTTTTRLETWASSPFGPTCKSACWGLIALLENSAAWAPRAATHSSQYQGKRHVPHGPDMRQTDPGYSRQTPLESAKKSKNTKFLLKKTTIIRLLCVIQPEMSVFNKIFHYRSF
jgi:hypothetical protein